MRIKPLKCFYLEICTNKNKSLQRPKASEGSVLFGTDQKLSKNLRIWNKMATQARKYGLFCPFNNIFTC